MAKDLSPLLLLWDGSGLGILSLAIPNWSKGVKAMQPFF